MNKILLGLDGSASSFKALLRAMELAKLYDAELHTISVEELPHFSETIGEIAEEKDSEDTKFNSIVLKAKEIADAGNLQIATHVFIGHEVKTIIDFAKKQKFDLLAIGFTGNSAIYERVMGSTCQSLVRLAPCSVLVIK